MTSFAISESTAGDVIVLAVHGEIDVATAPVLARRLSKPLRAQSPRLVIDLGDTMFVDATGLAVLLNSLRRVTRGGGRLAIACANPTVLRLFEVTKTAPSFAIFSGRNAAVAYAAEREDVVVSLPTGRDRRAREAARRRGTGVRGLRRGS